MAYNETLLIKEIEMFKKEQTIAAAVSVRCGHTMTIRKKEYVVTSVGTYDNGNLEFFFKNVKDDQDCLQVLDVPPFTIVTINISRQALIQEINKEFNLDIQESYLD